MIKKILPYLPVLAGLSILLLPSSRLTLFPTGKERLFRLDTYVDHTDTTRGSLGTVREVGDSLLVFEFTLRQVNNNPFIRPISGFSLWFDKHAEGNYLDVSAYDYLDIDVRLKEGTSFVLYFKTFEHFTDTNNWMTLRYTGTEVPLELRPGRCRLRFREFPTPTWWKSLIGPRFLSLPDKPDYSRLMGIDFQNTPGDSPGVQERMEIHRIAFVKSRGLRDGIAVGVCMIWVVTVILVSVGRKRTGSAAESEERPVRHVHLADQSDEFPERLARFIGEHFQLPELSVEQVGRETGISPARISTFLQKRYGMSFKQYLNDIRIAEAKRLLLESDRSVAEIAFAVGYNSIPHFNRVFRRFTDTTPTYFRESMEDERGC